MQSGRRRHEIRRLASYGTRATPACFILSGIFIGSTGYPDASRGKDFFDSDRMLGGSYQSLPVDLSEKRLCEGRCLALLDDMNKARRCQYDSENDYKSE